MRKIIIIILIVSVPFILFHCGSINKIYQEPLGLGFIVVFGDGRMLRFEESVACYYKTYNKFPEEDSVFNEFSNRLKFSENDTLVFSNIHREQTTNDNLIYNFQLHPWNGSLKSDSSDSFMDSIIVYQFDGKIEFNDSLITQNIDSLIVEIEISTLCATVFNKDDSIHYNNIEYPNALIDQMKFTSKKISLSNNCSKSNK